MDRYVEAISHFPPCLSLSLCRVYERKSMTRMHTCDACRSRLLVKEKDTIGIYMCLVIKYIYGPGDLSRAKCVAYVSNAGIRLRINLRAGRKVLGYYFIKQSYSSTDSFAFATLVSCAHSLSMYRIYSSSATIRLLSVKRK